MEKLTADARYEKIWHLFLSELERQPRIRLTAYLRSKHVYQRGFEKWMSRHGYSVREAKGRILRLKMESVNAGKEGVDRSTFLPVRLAGNTDAASELHVMLTGISLTFPDGTAVNIRRGSAEAVVSFLKLYSGEGVSCSD
jgi:hypothetical protein